MRTGFITDTGPIVALLNSRDQHHDWAREMFGTIEPPLATCEAVISEACFLAGKFRGGPQAVLGLLSRGVLEIPFRLAPNQLAIQSLMAKYSSVPMSVADACLVRMAELDTKRTILTLDSDFKIYRRHGRHVLPIATPR